MDQRVHMGDGGARRTDGAKVSMCAVLGGSENLPRAYLRAQVQENHVPRPVPLTQP